MSEISESDIESLLNSVKKGFTVWKQGEDTLNNLVQHYRDTQWIDVTERLPENKYQDVLTLDDTGYMQIYHCAEPEVWSAWNITHWMPLPQPPRGSDD